MEVGLAAGNYRIYEAMAVCNLPPANIGTGVLVGLLDFKVMLVVTKKSTPGK